MFRWLKRLKKQRITKTKAVIQYEKPWYIRLFIAIAAFLAGILIAALVRVTFIEDALRTVTDPVLTQRLKECESFLSNQQDIDTKISDAQTDTLTQQLSRLQTENTQLKSDLAVYEKLSATSAKPGEATIRELSISRLPSGEYQYQVLVAYSPPQGASSEQEVFDGTLFLSADLANNNQTIIIAGQGGGSMSPPIDLRIRYFQRLSGTFTLEEDQKIQLFRARIRKNGRVIDTKTEMIPPSFYQNQSQ